MKVALPAVLTNLATPVASAYVTHAMARFGAAAVAGQATIDRITPVAFAVIYALTGAVGPIIAQNLGAGRADRIRETIRNSLVFVLLTVAVAWVVLALVQGGLIRAFSARGDTAVDHHGILFVAGGELRVRWLPVRGERDLQQS